MSDPQPFMGSGKSFQQFTDEMRTLAEEIKAARKAANLFGDEIAFGPAPKEVPKFATVEEAEQWMLLERARQRVHAEQEAIADEKFVEALTQQTLGPPPAKTIDWANVVMGLTPLPPGTKIDFEP